MQNLSDENVYKGIVNSGDAFTYIKSLTIPLGGKVYIAFSNECTNIPTQYSWWAVEVYNIENNFVAIATGTWSPNDQYYVLINPSIASAEYEWKKYVTNADFTQYVFEETNVSIPASGDVTLDFDISKSGYRVIGVVGFASSSSYAAFSRVQTTFSENKVSVTLRNTSSNQITTIARIQVLYVPA